MGDATGWWLVLLGILCAALSLFSAWGGTDLLLASVMGLTSLAVVVVGLRRLVRGPGR